MIVSVAWKPGKPIVMQQLSPRGKSASFLTGAWFLSEDDLLIRRPLPISRLFFSKVEAEYFAR
jgi:hypothetical protein